MVDPTVLLPVDSDEKEVKCLNRWIEVSSRYPAIVKPVTAILLIFHGSQFESIFCKMNQVLDDKSGNMDVQTLNAILTVKYSFNVNQVRFYLIKSICISVYVK